MIVLYATPLSHFSRKVRLLLDSFQLPYQFVDIGNVAQSDRQVFGNNPLMKVPALTDGERWFVESDHIAQYLVLTYDPQDRYRVFEKDWSRLNIRAVMNGIMQEEVKLILAERAGVPVQDYSFFRKSRQAIVQGMEWLEQHASEFDSQKPGYLEFHLVCLLEHLMYYKIVDLNTPQLQQICEQLAKNKTIHQTSPAVLKGKVS